MSKRDEEEYGSKPANHPLMLFSNNSEIPTFFLAENHQNAKKQNPDKNEVFVIEIGDLINQFGHTRTNNFLKKFGPSWICKTGRIYFKDRKQLEKSISRSNKGQYD